MAGQPPLFAQTYTFTQIDGPKSTFTEARGINDNGEAVGEFSTTTNKGVTTTTGFLYNTMGRMISFGPRGASVVQAIGVNSSEQVVGMYLDAASNVWHGYRYAKGKFTSLDPAGSTLTFVWGINENGQAVGSFTDAGTPSAHGFLYTSPTSAPLDVPSVTTGFTAPLVSMARRRRLFSDTPMVRSTASRRSEAPTPRSIRRER